MPQPLRLGCPQARVTLSICIWAGASDSTTSRRLTRLVSRRRRPKFSSRSLIGTLKVNHSSNGNPEMGYSLKPSAGAPLSIFMISVPLTSVAAESIYRSNLSSPACTS